MAGNELSSSAAWPGYDLFVMPSPPSVFGFVLVIFFVSMNREPNSFSTGRS